MAAVLDIAAFILARHGAMSAMKLQKLVYYSQAWSLALRQTALFDEDFQAWAHGPVVRELFREHRGQYVVTHVSGDPGSLSRGEVSLVDSVLSGYGAMSAEELSDLTHREDPWRLARGAAHRAARSSAMISKESMSAFYSARRPPFVWSADFSWR